MFNLQFTEAFEVHDDNEQVEEIDKLSEKLAGLTNEDASNIEEVK